MIPSFPQRGQPKFPLLEVPDDAPDYLKKWLSQVRLGVGYVRWFGLLKPEIEALWNAIGSGREQLLGQSEDLVNAVTQNFIARVVAMELSDADRSYVLNMIENDDPERKLAQAWDFTVIQDTRANRANYPAAQFDGRVYAETDSGSTLVYRSTGGAWKYAWGRTRTTLANILTGLGANDTGLINVVTDYSHGLLWSGSAWGWDDEDSGSGFYAMFEAAPSGYGTNAWALCDGSTVARLNPDGTTTNVALDNLTTAAYLKGATASAAVAAAGGATGAPSATTVVDNDLAVSTVAVASAAHTHAAGTFELRNLTKRLYYRR